MAPGQSSIFDDCEEPIPEYPSHDFIRTEETVLIDPVPVAISEVSSFVVKGRVYVDIRDSFLLILLSHSFSITESFSGAGTQRILC